MGSTLKTRRTLLQPSDIDIYGLAINDIAKRVTVSATAAVASLVGLQVVDGYQTVDGDLVLLTNQASSSADGIWVVHAGAWTRPTNFAIGMDVQGTVVNIQGGTVRGGFTYSLISTGPVFVDVTAQLWRKGTFRSTNVPNTDAEVFVSKSTKANDGNAGDSWGTAFATIAAAIAGTGLSSVKVNLGCGTWTEQVSTTKRVHFVGVGQEMTTLQPTAGGNAIFLNGSGTVRSIFEHLTIDGVNTGAAANGLNLGDNAHEVALRDVCIKNFTVAGSNGLTNVDHAFTLALDHCFIVGNDTNMYLKGNVQNLRADKCSLLQPITKNVKLGDGSSLLVQMNFNECNIENNGTTGTAPVDFELNAVELNLTGGIYTEQDKTGASFISVLANASFPTIINLHGVRALGNSTANTFIQLPADDTTEVYINGDSVRLESYTGLSITNSERAKKHIDIRTAGGGGQFALQMPRKHIQTAAFVTPYGGIGAAQNRLFWSEQFDNAAWVASTAGAGVAPTVTPNAAAAPDGTMTADQITFGAFNSRLTQTSAVTGVTGTDYVYSVWLRTDAAASISLALHGNTQNVVLSQRWTRYYVRLTAAVSNGNGVALTVRISAENANQSGAVIYAWGAQLEVASSSGPYVRTVGAASSSLSGVVLPDGSSLGSPAGRIPLATGDKTEAYDHRMIRDITGAMTSGTAVVTSIPVVLGETYSALNWISGSIALVLGTSPHYWVLIMDRSRKVLAVSADNTAPVIAASTVQPVSFVTPWVADATQWVYGVVMVGAGTGGTQPTFQMFAGSSAPNNRAPISSGTSVTTTALPAVGDTLPSLTANSQSMWASLS